VAGTEWWHVDDSRAVVGLVVLLAMGASQGHHLPTHVVRRSNLSERVHVSTLARNQRAVVHDPDHLYAGLHRVAQHHEAGGLDEPDLDLLAVAHDKNTPLGALGGGVGKAHTAHQVTPLHS
jgi:hypothetical protein